MRRIRSSRVAEYYGDREAGFTSSTAIVNAIKEKIVEFPRYFRRSEIVAQLNLRYQREISLLSDALYTLKLEGLIEFDTDAKQWKNLTRF